MCLQKVVSKKIRNKKLFFVGISEVTDGKSRIQIRIRKSSGRIQSKDLDPYKNVTDPEHSVLHNGFSHLNKFHNLDKSLLLGESVGRAQSSPILHRSYPAEGGTQGLPGRVQHRDPVGVLAHFLWSAII
jgi:hypothetical protein